VKKNENPCYSLFSLSQLGLSDTEMESVGGFTASEMGSGGDEGGFSLYYLFILFGQ
jgi:hypothetical protein